MQQDGQGVHKINFNSGDAALWRAGSDVPYRDTLDQLPAFYKHTYQQYKITDIVLFGDQRPVHQAAIVQARASGLRTHVFEEGYFRPYWVTLEREGVNNNSLLPKDPNWYREIGPKIPQYRNGKAFSSSFAVRAWHDVAYNACGLASQWQYPNYRGHAPTGAWQEYAAYVRRALRLRGRESQDKKAIASLVRADSVFYLFALQLDSDAQIRVHSDFKNITEALAVVIKSFAQHADDQAVLVIKNHPLDPGLVHYESIAKQLAQDFDVAGRIVFLETGHLPTLLTHATGVVTINSTVGGSALMHACRTIALSQPIYAMPGLTFQGKLDDFWHDAQPPDMTLFHHFRNTVIHTTQVNGGFYSKAGIGMAVENSVSRLMDLRSPLDMLL